jgi:hypothetical protein
MKKLSLSTMMAFTGEPEVSGTLRVFGCGGVYLVDLFIDIVIV